MIVENINNDNYYWFVTNGESVSPPNSAAITYNDIAPMNDWFFTSRLQLT
jgi:hypothetical protein